MIRSRTGFLGLPWSWWWAFSAFWLATDAIMLGAGVVAGIQPPSAFLLTPVSLVLRMAPAIALFALARAWPWDGEPQYRALLVNSLGWMGISVLSNAAWYLHPPTVGAQGFAEFMLAQLPRSLLVNINVLGVAHAAYFLHRSRMQERQEADLASALARVELERLQAEVQPQVVVRALDGIARVAETDPVRADRALNRFATMLRMALARRTGPSTVEDEVGFAVALLELHREERGGPVTWEVAVDAAAQRGLLPPRALSLLVDHFLVHAGPGALAVRLQVRRDGGSYEVAVHASCDGRPVVLNERELRPLRTTIKLLPGAGALVAGSVSDYSSLALRVAAEPAAGASGRWEKA